MRKTLAALAVALPLHAAAVEFNVVKAERSRIAFVSTQMGVPVEGEFRKFAAQVAFDPARPEAGRARIEVELAAFDAGHSDVNAEAQGRNWFDVRQFPRATFVSSGVRMLGGDRYAATGRLSIKGVTRDVVAPFTFRRDGVDAVLEGSLPLLRLQFGIGSGAWADTATVADEVHVKFRFSVAAGH